MSQSSSVSRVEGFGGIDAAWAQEAILEAEAGNGPWAVGIGPFPAELFLVDGEPDELAVSARRWDEFGQQCQQAADRITGFDLSRFVGIEGRMYAAVLSERLADRLDVVADTYGHVGAALEAYAAELARLQRAMAPIAAQAPHTYRELQEYVESLRRGNIISDLMPATIEEGRRLWLRWKLIRGQAGDLQRALSAAVHDCERAIRAAGAYRFTENPIAARLDLAGARVARVIAQPVHDPADSVSLRVTELAARQLVVGDIASALAPAVTTLVAAAIDTAGTVARGGGAAVSIGVGGSDAGSVAGVVAALSAAAPFASAATQLAGTAVGVYGPYAVASYSASGELGAGLWESWVVGRGVEHRLPWSIAATPATHLDQGLDAYASELLARHLGWQLVATDTGQYAPTRPDTTPSTGQGTPVDTGAVTVAGGVPLVARVPVWVLRDRRERRTRDLDSRDTTEAVPGAEGQWRLGLTPGAGYAGLLAPTAGGDRGFVLINDPHAPVRYRFLDPVPADSHLHHADDDTLTLRDPANRPLASLPAPRAVDALGNPVESDYHLDGGDLVHTVRPGGHTVFPILTDPHPDTESQSDTGRRSGTGRGSRSAAAQHDSASASITAVLAPAQRTFSTVSSGLAVLAPVLAAQAPVIEAAVPGAGTYLVSAASSLSTASSGFASAAAAVTSLALATDPADQTAALTGLLSGLSSGTLALTSATAELGWAAPAIATTILTPIDPILHATADAIDTAAPELLAAALTAVNTLTPALAAAVPQLHTTLTGLAPIAEAALPQALSTLAAALNTAVPQTVQAATTLGGTAVSLSTQAATLTHAATTAGLGLSLVKAIPAALKIMAAAPGLLRALTNFTTSSLTTTHALAASAAPGLTAGLDETLAVLEQTARQNWHQAATALFPAIMTTRTPGGIPTTRLTETGPRASSLFTTETTDPARAATPAEGTNAAFAQDSMFHGENLLDATLAAAPSLLSGLRQVSEASPSTTRAGDIPTQADTPLDPTPAQRFTAELLHQALQVAEAHGVDQPLPDPSPTLPAPATPTVPARHRAAAGLLSSVTPVEHGSDPARGAVPDPGIVPDPDTHTATAGRFGIGALTITPATAGTTPFIAQTGEPGQRIRLVLDPRTGYEQLTHPAHGGERTLIVVNNPDAPHTYQFQQPVPPGGRMVVEPDGSVTILDHDNNPIQRLKKPWARDAAGRKIPTEFTADGATLTQTIHPDTHTLYPLLADPDPEPLTTPEPPPPAVAAPISGPPQAPKNPDTTGPSKSDTGTYSAEQRARDQKIATTQGPGLEAQREQAKNNLAEHPATVPQCSIEDDGTLRIDNPDTGTQTVYQQDSSGADYRYTDTNPSAADSGGRQLLTSGQSATTYTGADGDGNQVQITVPATTDTLTTLAPETSQHTELDGPQILAAGQPATTYTGIGSDGTPTKVEVPAAPDTVITTPGKKEGGADDSAHAARDWVSGLGHALAAGLDLQDRLTGHEGWEAMKDSWSSLGKSTADTAVDLSNSDTRAHMMTDAARDALRLQELKEHGPQYWQTMIGLDIGTGVLGDGAAGLVERAGTGLVERAGTDLAERAGTTEYASTRPGGATTATDAAEGSTATGARSEGTALHALDDLPDTKSPPPSDIETPPTTIEGGTSSVPAQPRTGEIEPSEASPPKDLLPAQAEPGNQIGSAPPTPAERNPLSTPRTDTPPQYGYDSTPNTGTDTTRHSDSPATIPAPRDNLDPHLHGIEHSPSPKTAVPPAQEASPGLAERAGQAAPGAERTAATLDNAGQANEATSKSVGRTDRVDSGYAYERSLIGELGGTGEFKVGQRTFDGRFSEDEGKAVWYEAKSGRFWEDEKRVAKFKSQAGQQNQIAIQNGAEFRVYSEQPIPASVRSWLDKKNIPYEVRPMPGGHR